MSKSIEDVRAFIREELASITGEPADSFGAESALVGSDSSIKSRQLVELLLALEEYADDEMGLEFDWTNDAAMSNTRGFLRSVESLSEHIAGLADGT